MKDLEDQSIDLLVTSPPYPMIEMWDQTFSCLSPKAARALKKSDGACAFEAMHQELDQVWKECFRVLKPGRFLCINVGDATRTINKTFCLYPNHARILSAAQKIGFYVLPCIIWRKQTNAPNKYMGSGMLPAGAYVTLEHEYILILRKGEKRVFTRDLALRHESALFWEERNLWFSDVWMDLKGSRQTLGRQAARDRSGAFPFELATRLILMYSIKGDLVLDPFLGTGTTMAGAMATGRNSLGFELDPTLVPEMGTRIQEALHLGQALATQRLTRHLDFVRERVRAKGPLKHRNAFYGFPVMTRQEKSLRLPWPRTLSPQAPFRVIYDPGPQQDFVRDWDALSNPAGPLHTPGNLPGFN